MARALGKSHVRVLGIDDGPFSRQQRFAPVVALAMSTPSDIEGIAATWVSVDGNDATERILSLVGGSPLVHGARAVVVDGVAVAGFNVLDLDRLCRSLERPVVTVTRRRPDFPAIRAALRKYFPRQARARYRLLSRHPLFRVPTSGAPIYASAVGCSRREAIALLERLRLHGFWPEPLRLAHLVARAVAAGRPPSSVRRRPRARTVMGPPPVRRVGP